MALDANDIGYFIQNVGLAAASFGVAESDVAAVGCALSSTFGFACSPASDPLMVGEPRLQSICTDESCPRDQGAVCGAYPGGGFSVQPVEGVPGSGCSAGAGTRKAK